MTAKKIPMAKLIQVIEADQKEGKGVEGDPVRSVATYWSTDGNILAWLDPCAPLYDRATGEWVIQKNAKYRVE